MFVERRGGKITTWFVAFLPRSGSRLCNWLIPGRFKHVCAFAYCPENQSWAVVEPDACGTEVAIFPAVECWVFLEPLLAAGAVIVKIAARKRRWLGPRLIGCCTSNVRDLVGLPGCGILSLLPDMVYRDCLRHGGVNLSLGVDEMI